MSSNSSKRKPKVSPIPDRLTVGPVDPNAPVHPPPPALVHTDPRQWNAQWEDYNHEKNRLDSGFTINAEAQAAQYPILLTERQHANRKRLRSAILDNVYAISLSCLSAVHLLASTGGRSYDEIWSSMTRSRREDMMLKALQEVELTCPSQRLREEAPEITLEAMCGGRGEGFNKLLHHFYVDLKTGSNDEWERPTEFPLLRHERQWINWNLERDPDALPLSRGERAFQESLLYQKHIYLTLFVRHLMKEMAGVKSEHHLPKKTTSVRTPPDVLTRLRAKFTYVAEDGEVTPKPDAFRDKEFVEWGGQWYCEVMDCRKSERDLEKEGESKMLLCGPCRKLKRATAYCSEACQKKDWKAHKNTCGRPLGDVTDIPIFSSNTGLPNPDPTSSSPPKVGALLSQQILFHQKFPNSQWAVRIDDGPSNPGKSLCLILMDPELDKKAIELHDKYRELAFSTREPKNVGWLFTSLALHLFPILGSKHPQPDLKQLTAVTPVDFTHQFMAAFEIDEAQFLSGLPTTQELINYELEWIPRLLNEFTSGKYPHHVLSFPLEQQVQLRRNTPIAFWGVLISTTTKDGPLKNLVAVGEPDHPMNPYREDVRTRALATGDPEAIGELYFHCQLLLKGKWEKGPLQWTTYKDFGEQFAKAWGTSVEVLDKWLDDDAGVEMATAMRKDWAGISLT